MQRTLILLAASTLYTVLASAAFAAALPPNQEAHKNGLTCFNGYAYALQSGDYRYTEHHEVKREDGHITTWNVTYIGPNGHVLAKKHMDFSDWPTVPVYRMTMHDSGYEEGIRHRQDQDQWTMFKRNPSQAEKQTTTFSIDPPMAAESGINQLVKEHFDSLQSGRTIHFKLPAPNRQAVLSLKMYKAGATTFEDRPAIKIKADLDMFLITWLVSPLQLTYDLKTERLLESRGIGDIHNKNGETYSVRVIYADQMPEAAKAHGAPAANCGSISGQS